MLILYLCLYDNDRFKILREKQWLSGTYEYLGENVYYV